MADETSGGAGGGTTADESDSDRQKASVAARGWLLECSVATLCTTSAQRDIEGYPFGSVVPFALSAEGHPIVMLADIAAHTANLRRDPRASLFVRDPHAAEDPQSTWRITVIGSMQRIPRPEVKPRPGDLALEPHVLEDLEARYLERVPSAISYRKTHDFSLWRMSSVVKGRYIAGFGEILWLGGDALLRDPGGRGLREAAPGAVAHMNEDHAHNLAEMCAGAYGFTPERAEMTHIDRTGFLVKTTGPERLLHFSFGREIAADGLRAAVIDVLKRCRAGVLRGSETR